MNKLVAHGEAATATLRNFQNTQKKPDSDKKQAKKFLLGVGSRDLQTQLS